MSNIGCYLFRLNKSIESLIWGFAAPGDFDILVATNVAPGSQVSHTLQKQIIEHALTVLKRTLDP